MIETQVRLDAYRALLRLPDDDGLRRRSHLTQPGAADRHPRVWLRLMDAYHCRARLADMTSAFKW